MSSFWMCHFRAWADTSRDSLLAQFIWRLRVALRFSVGLSLLISLHSNDYYVSSPPEEKSWIGRSILLNSPLPNKEGLIILQSIILFLYLRALRRCYTGAVGEVHPFADCMRLQGDNTPAED